MTWIDKKEHWINKPGQTDNYPSKPERSYSVTDVAEFFGVSRQTVYAWLSLDEPGLAIIPTDAWFRLPSGHVRIRESAIIKLQYNAKQRKP